jgi:hypothetical protein
MEFSNEIERSRYQRWYSDFLTVTPIELVMSAVGTGAQNTAVAPQVASQVGVVKSELGTVATNTVGWATNPSVARLDAGGKWKFEAIITSAANLSDGTDTYTLRIGFLDSQTAEPTDGVFFRYSHALSAGVLQCVTRANGVETVVANVLTLAANGVSTTWAVNTTYKFNIEVLADGSKAFFSLNGILIASQTLTIPVGAGRETGWGAVAIKSVGTANKGEFYTDYCDVVCIFR